MKKKDFNDFKSKEASEIAKKISELEKEKAEKSLQIKMGKIKNVKTASQIKKDIARLYTLLNLKLLTDNKPVKKEETNVAS